MSRTRFAAPGWDWDGAIIVASNREGLTEEVFLANDPNLKLALHKGLETIPFPSLFAIPVAPLLLRAKGETSEAGEYGPAKLSLAVPQRMYRNLVYAKPDERNLVALIEIDRMHMRAMEAGLTLLR